MKTISEKKLQVKFVKFSFVLKFILGDLDKNKMPEFLEIIGQ